MSRRNGGGASGSDEFEVKTHVWESRGPAVLIAAGVLVGVAIALDGAAARGINGIAGIAWIVAAWLLVRTNVRAGHGRAVLGVTGVVALILVLAVKPSDLLWAAVGFTAGGAIVATVARAELEQAALLLPALWLPVHLLVAIVRVIERAVRDLPATVRTDPPPTAALVPLAMVIAAFAGGWAVDAIRARQAGRVSQAGT